MNDPDSAPAVKPGYYVAVPTGAGASRAWGARPGVVEYVDLGGGDAHWRGASDARMAQDPRDLGYTIYPVDALPAPQAAAEVHLAAPPLAHQEQDAEEMAKHLAEKHGIAYPVELGGLASWILAVVGARNQTIRERDAAQATAERLRAALVSVKLAIETNATDTIWCADKFNMTAVECIDAALAATDAYDMMTPDDPIADREGMRRAIQEYLLRVGRAPAPPPTPEGTA
jgi:hypothetical protein